ncbi:MAG: class I SAM-dependent rRNA methyltransferase [Prevotella sp.]|nr:class I SAM-dependent rRNA methyltransferase [Prevotella sp.]
MMKQVQLRKGKEESLKRFHPWVFSGAIARIDEGVSEGEIVRVVTNSGDFIAVGHYQEGSIAVRVLTFSDVQIDDEFWHSRLSSALQMRQAIGIADNPNNNTYRLVHGEGDNLPGLIIDVYGQTAVMQAHSIGMHLCRKEIAHALVDVMESRISHIYYKSETTLPFMTADDMNATPHFDNDEVLKNGFLVGGSDDNIATENGLKFRVDWLKGQKTGFFVDQRENRSLLEKFSKGKRVLNMFCYTGGFSFYAMRGGAELVHSVDSSAKAIELTKQNVELNFPGDARHEAYCEDAFKYLERAGSNYNLIILDPPAFAKHRGALHNALKGYTRLNQKAFEKIEKGGILFTFSCSQVVTKDHFRNAVFTAAALAKRKVRILHQLHQPADHPINIYHPEGEYLKGLVLYVE